jgi:hypothetical protein
MYKVKSPVLFLIFNRPEETQLVFEAIKKAKPAKLYVAADGPRPLRPNDASLCEQTKDIIKNINWECEVQTLFRNNNLGCKNAVSSAVTWFFQNEPEGIVLEDDCLPSEDFFVFADEMLEYYRYNEKVAHVCGCNFQDGIKRDIYSYYYSNITHVWGWAGWRRVWEKYDVDLNWLDDGLKKDFLKTLTDSHVKKTFFRTSLEKVKSGQIDTWDYQYGFLNNYNKMVAVIPQNNMISNIGFNENGTHTLTDSIQANVRFGKLVLPLVHPPVISANRAADQYTLNKEITRVLSVYIDAAKFHIKKLFKY